MIIVACVWTGEKYGLEYVERLRAGVARHFHLPHTFICLTDRWSAGKSGGIVWVPVQDSRLDSWWAKMWLFDPSYRREARVIYFDLDTVLINDITHLGLFEEPFGICTNFARAAGIPWRCTYGSCTMILNPELSGHVWERFSRDVDGWKVRAGRYGDQWVIEQILGPECPILQERFPGTFINHRDLQERPPEAASIVVFGGRARPDNCDLMWIQKAWRGDD